MGWRLVEEVQRYAPKTLTWREKYTLTVYASLARDETRICYPRIEDDPDVIQRLGLGRSERYAVQTSLIEKGALELITPGGRHHAAAIRIANLAPDSQCPETSDTEDNVSVRKPRTLKDSQCPGIPDSVSGNPGPNPYIPSRRTPPPTSSSRPAAEATQEEERKPTTSSRVESVPDAGLRDQAAQLLDAVQWPLGGRPSPVDHGRLVKWVARCLQAGHPDAAVTRELSEAMSAQRPVGAAIARLRTLAGMPPQQTDTDRASNPVSTPTTRWEWELPPCEHEIPGGNMPVAPGVLRCPMCRRQAARGSADRIATQERDDEPAATDAPRPRPSKRASLRGRRATPPRTEREELSEEEFEERRRTYLAALEAFMAQETTANPPRPVAAVEATNSDTLTDTTPDASCGLLEALRADSGVCVGDVA